jgi:hypothetical protein
VPGAREGRASWSRNDPDASFIEGQTEELRTGIETNHGGFERTGIRDFSGLRGCCVPDVICTGADMEFAESQVRIPNPKAPPGG